MEQQQLWAVHHILTSMTTLMRAEVGRDFTISMEENPTTGYTWKANHDENLLTLKESRYVRTTYLIGGGGIKEIVFIPLAAGRTAVTLELRRDWEDEPVRTRQIDVEIAEAHTEPE
jgi:inhibitor of cysteine peptidase